MRNILTGPSLHSINQEALDEDVSSATEELELEDSMESGSSSEEEIKKRNSSRKQKAKIKKQKELLARFKLIPEVVSKLRVVDACLSDLFDSCFGMAATLEKKVVSHIYRDLFIQVSE